METDRLLKIISDSFGPKAESIDVEYFHLYFERRFNILDEMKMPMHQFVTGRKGTGKTTYLKYFDLATVSASEKRTNILSFIGFYINLGKFAIPNFQLLSAELATEVFNRWLPLKIIFTVIDGFKKSRKSGYISLADQSIIKIFDGIIDDSKIKNLENLIEDINDEINRLEYLCCKQDFNIKDIQKGASVSLRSVSLNELANKIAKNIKKLIRENIDVLPAIFFLFDRFDEMPIFLQSIAKGLINWGDPQDYFVKIGVSNFDKLYFKKDIPPRDYRILSIEFATSHKGHDEFQQFAISVLQKRLAVIADTIKKMDREEPLSAILRNVDKLFSAVSRADNEILFYGLDLIIKLSSRNISIFLAFIFAILREVISNRQEYAIFSESGAVPHDIQDKSIRNESYSRYSQEFKSQSSPNAVKLLKFLVNQLHPKDKFEKNLFFSFKGMVESPQNHVVREAIEELYNLNIISQSIDPEKEGEFELSQYFLPHWNRIVALDGKMEIPVSKAKDYIIGEAIPDREEEKQKKLFERQPVCFYATGFRKPWENKARMLLREKIFIECGLEYKDGSDYHPDTIELGENIKSLIKDADFFILEISTYNENVAFEMGLGIASKKPMYAIKNKTTKESDIDLEPSSDFRDFVDSIKYEIYDFEYNDLTLSSEPRAENINSLKKAIGLFADLFKNLPDNKKNNWNPFNKTISLIPSAMTEKMVYIYSPENSRLSSWRQDIEGRIRDEKISSPYPFGSEKLKGKDMLIMSHLQAICRSKHCVIDTTGKDQYSCLLLGFALGIGGPEILHVYEQDSPGLFTNWKGWPYRPYKTKEELWALTKEFLQKT